MAVAGADRMFCDRAASVVGVNLIPTQVTVVLLLRVLRSGIPQVAKAKLGEFQSMQLRGEKYSDPFASHRNRPLAEHIADYNSELQTLGRDEKYIYNVEKRLFRLLKSCDWKLLAD